MKCRDAKFLVRFSLQRSRHCLLLKSKVFFPNEVALQISCDDASYPPSPPKNKTKKKNNKNKNKEKKKEMWFSLDDKRECKALCAEYFFLLWQWSLGWAVSTLTSSFQNWMHRVLVVLFLFCMSLCSTNVLFSPNSLHPFRKYPFSQTNSSSSIFFSRIGKATICTC